MNIKPNKNYFSQANESATVILSVVSNVANSCIQTCLLLVMSFFFNIYFYFITQTNVFLYVISPQISHSTFIWTSITLPILLAPFSHASGSNFHTYAIFLHMRDNTQYFFFPSLPSTLSCSPFSIPLTIRKVQIKSPWDSSLS